MPNAVATAFNRSTRVALAAGIAALALLGSTLTATSVQAAPASSAPATAAAADPTRDAMVLRIFSDTNAVRASYDLPALKLSTAIGNVAQNWSTRQATANDMTHNPSFSTEMPAGWRRAGENVAAGQQYTTVVNAWAGSPGHLANLKGDYTHIGIGVAKSSTGRWYYTQNFGKYPNGLADESLPIQEPPAPPATPGSTPVYRFWSDRMQGHFYTASKAERDSVITSYPPSVWRYEGIAYNAFTTQVAGSVPLYRFWSAAYGAHFYTADADESRFVKANYPTIWSYERVAFYVYPVDSTQGTAVSRFWSAPLRHHFFTASTTERDSVKAAYPGVWSFEGAKFRVPSE